MGRRGFWVRTQRLQRRSQGKGSEGKGGRRSMNQLPFVVQMLLATVTAGEARDWWAGLNCKVHFRLMAVAARL